MGRNNAYIIGAALVGIAAIYLFYNRKNNKTGDDKNLNFGGNYPIKRSISSSRKKSHISSGRKKYSGRSTGWD